MREFYDYLQGIEYKQFKEDIYPEKVLVESYVKEKMQEMWSDPFGWITRLDPPRFAGLVVGVKRYSGGVRVY